MKGVVSGITSNANKCHLRKEQNEKQNEKTITTITMCAFDWVWAN